MVSSGEAGSPSAVPMIVEPPTPLTLLDSEPGAFRFYGWKNFTIIGWTAKATGAAVARLRKVTDAAVLAHPEGISNVHLIGRGAGVPTPEARDGLIEMMTAHQKKLACVAIVLPGRAFAVAALRAAIIGIRAAAPQSFAFRMHEAVDDVGRWVPREHLKRTSVLVHPNELSTALWDAWKAMS